MKPGKAGQRRGEAGQVLRWRPRFCRFLPELWKWKAAQTCPTLCNPMDYTVHGILQARILEWVAFVFSRESSQPRDWAQVSCIASGFFTSWAIREAQEYWSGQSIPSPVDLPNPGIEPGFPVLQADSLPTELSGKPQKLWLNSIFFFFSSKSSQLICSKNFCSMNIS